MLDQLAIPRIGTGQQSIQRYEESLPEKFDLDFCNRILNDLLDIKCYCSLELQIAIRHINKGSDDWQLSGKISAIRDAANDLSEEFLQIQEELYRQI